ncbi:LysR family transcriptional regulator [uncultured Oscillibacter sp.]|uniref:LysR family transcriptional regulator n=1 Tax=uncultured Oscillibacter sp. TaxID=876091 RepID=UPI0025FB52AD|nr:LysR family transcriptional regulator [uncultured Oscillibacter sp.]
MELKNLRTFQAVVDQGSYQRAAERLGYAQSTITVQIQQLEEELGVPLFERLGRRMVLTEAGERILPQARELLLGAERLLESGREDGVLSGILRVDMAETLLCYKAQPVIRAFRERAPQVRLVIRSCNCMRIPINVRTGACDLGVGYDMDWDREALEVEPMGEYDIVLLASPRFAEPDFVTPGQRKAASLVTDEPDSIFRRRLEAYLREREIELDVTLELWSIETIKRCVMSDLGFTYLPRFVAEEELADGRLAELGAPVSGVPAPALCAWRKGRWIAPAMELFLELLREALA